VSGDGVGGSPIVNNVTEQSGGSYTITLTGQVAQITGQNYTFTRTPASIWKRSALASF
jgi:hypothetical protein